MNSKLSFILYCVIVTVIGCKVHPKNSEPSVRLLFFPAKVDSKKDFCFDNVKNKNDKSYSTCIDSVNNYLDIPLNLNETSCSIVFSKNRKTDTLTIAYSISMQYKDGEFDSNLTDFKIVETTFDSLSTNDKPSKILNKNVKESISIYY